MSERAARVPKCPNCGSLDVVGGEGYFFCNVCGWDELDGVDVEKSQGERDN